MKKEQEQGGLSLAARLPYATPEIKLTSVELEKFLAASAKFVVGTQSMPEIEDLSFGGNTDSDIEMIL
ncbi:MAG: hypothetical protein LBR48_06020 [Dysgonamonadaceae bacterium]|nr:hypothetical protein [Dysgonamonadaceae bacterium]